MKLTTIKIKQMIQEELKNVLEARTTGGRPDGYMTDDERRYYEKLYGAAPQPKQSSPATESGKEHFGSPEEKELMKLQQLCAEGDEEACRQEQMMMQRMYGQGDRMFERKKKRKKNG
jgi:hypothetical protein